MCNRTLHLSKKLTSTKFPLSRDGWAHGLRRQAGAGDKQNGAIAQLGERLPCTQEVGSSILPGSTRQRT